MSLKEKANQDTLGSKFYNAYFKFSYGNEA